MSGAWAQHYYLDALRRVVFLAVVFLVGFVAALRRAGSAGSSAWASAHLTTSAGLNLRLLPILNDLGPVPW
jgi:hypothetical protein